MKTFVPAMMFVVFGAFILFMNACTHFASDDCRYGLQWLAESDVLPRHGSVLTAFVENCADGYRPIPHLFVRIFTGCLPKSVFNVANTAMLLALVAFVARYAVGEWKVTASKTILAISAVYCFLCKGESYLWCSGSLNYLWVAVATLGFLLLREKMEHGTLEGWRLWLAAMFAFFCGWLQEACVLPVCFAICVFGMSRLRDLSWRKALFYGAYGCGALLLIGSTVGRAGYANGAGHSLVEIAVNLIKIAWGVKVLWVVVLLIAFRPDRISWIRRNLFELLIILGSVLMISMVGFSGERCLYAANLIGVVLLVRMIDLGRRGTVVLSAAFAMLMIALVPFARQINGNFERCLTKYRESADGVTVHDRVDCGVLARFFYQFTYKWQQEGHVPAFADFYGNGKPLYALSSYMYKNLYLKDNFCIPENKLPIEGDFYALDSENAVIMPIDANSEFNSSTHTSVLDCQSPSSLIDRLKYEIELRRHPPVTHPELFSRLHTAHGDYLLLAKPPFCRQSLKSIKFVAKKQSAIPRTTDVDGRGV